MNKVLEQRDLDNIENPRPTLPEIDKKTRKVTCSIFDNALQGRSH